MRLEYVKCNCCGSNNFKFFCSARSHFGPELFQVVKCIDCQLIFVNPRMAGKEAEISERHVDSLKKEQVETLEKTVRNKFVLRKISRHKQGGNFLDFGSGTGTLVEEARRQGWNAYGLELNKSLARAANAYWGNESILSCTLDELALKFSDYFDVINSSRVFEHLTDPLGTLRALRPLLSKDGILSLDVPNISDIKTKLRRGSIINPTGHLYHFSSKTLSDMLIRAGFTVVEVKTSFSGVQILGRFIRNPVTASYLAYSLYRLPTFGFGLSVLAAKDSKSWCSMELEPADHLPTS